MSAGATDTLTFTPALPTRPAKRPMPVIALGLLMIAMRMVLPYASRPATNNDGLAGSFDKS